MKAPVRAIKELGMNEPNMEGVAIYLLYLVDVLGLDISEERRKLVDTQARWLD